MSAQIPNPESRIPNLFLVGFMASGKSTVGRALAERLGLRFIDLDEMIKTTAGCTIAQIIQDQGEAHFRQLETDHLRQAAAGEAAVIALGGGAFTQAINRALIAQAGVSVWLDAPFELCWERIQRDAVVRPLAATENEARIRFEQRIPLYEQARLRIPIAADTQPETIAAEILAHLSHS